MKGLLFTISMLLLPSLMMAQASGGQIRRNAPKPNATYKKKNIKTTSNVNLSFDIKGVTFKMIYVDGGSFLMGGTKEQGRDVEEEEKPIHQVTLSSFYIGETEVTQLLWNAVMEVNQSYKKGDNLPVENVSWYDCQKFIDKLNLLTGQKFRLPTEAEWEFAARGGKKSKYTKYSGSDSVNEIAWHDGNSGNETHPVKLKIPNELGLYDMSGNVSEWCLDGFADYEEESQHNPTGPINSSLRVVRGGSFFFAESCRISKRSNRKPEHSAYYTGLRLALSSPSKSGVQ